MSSKGDIEDVDFAGLTPWEQDTVHLALVTLRRHGFKVTVEPPSAAAPPWSGLLLPDAEAPDAAHLHCACPAHEAERAGNL